MGIVVKYVIPIVPILPDTYIPTYYVNVQTHLIKYVMDKLNILIVLFLQVFSMLLNI